MRLFPLGHHLALGGFSSVGARASLQGADRAAGSLPGRPAAGPGPALPGARGRGRRGAGGRGSGREGRGEPGRPRSAVCPLPSLRPRLRVSLSASPYSSLSASSVSLGLSASLSLTLCPPRPTPSLTVGVSLGDDVASSAVADLPSGGVVESGGGRARGSGRWVGVSTRSRVWLCV